MPTPKKTNSNSSESTGTPVPTVSGNGGKKVDAKEALKKYGVTTQTQGGRASVKAVNISMKPEDKAPQTESIRKPQGNIPTTNASSRPKEEKDKKRGGAKPPKAVFSMGSNQGSRSYSANKTGLQRRRANV